MKTRREFLAQSAAMGAVVLGSSASAKASSRWSMHPVPISTTWSAAVTPENAWNVYPRPQLVRKQWENLNGLWQYAITRANSGAPSAYDGEILVPYPLESALSGVRKALQPNQLLWYKRTVVLPASAGRTLLHFGAVDFRATVFLNGREVGSHSGGYQHFTIDITDAKKIGSNELVVRVYDPTDSESDATNPHGKQSLKPRRIFYTPTSGIWQTVWLENVPDIFVKEIVVTPDVDDNSAMLEVVLDGSAAGVLVKATISQDGHEIASHTIDSQTSIPIPHARLWSPHDPFLYDLHVRVMKDGEFVDEVTSYFGMRKVEVRKDAAGIERIHLNNAPIYALGVLDQGFWPESLYAAPSLEALEFDVSTLKAMGFNTIRKHVKLEPDSWYHLCDRLGMMVWQDMVPPGGISAAGQAEFEREIHENIAQLHNHPSIIGWVLFNENWNEFDIPKLAHMIKQLEPLRLLDCNSGPRPWVSIEQLSPKQRVAQGLEWTGGDVTDTHHYPNPLISPAQSGKARIIGEYGGIGTYISGHEWKLESWGYIKLSREKLLETYREYAGMLRSLKSEGLSGSIYTQISDVEGEINGLMTYDRKIVKMPVNALAPINRAVITD